MTVALVLASGAGVAGVLEVAVRPAVGADGTAGSWGGAGSSGGGSGLGGRPAGWSRKCGDSVGGAVVTSRGGSGGEASVVVGRMEVRLEDGHGLVGVREAAPFTAGDVKQAGGIHDVVALADDRWHGGGVIAGGGKADTVFELGEEDFDGCWGVPSGRHAEEVGVKFSLGDAAVVVPEMDEKLQASDVAEAEGVVVEGADVGGRSGEDELVAKSLVRFVVGTKRGLGRNVETVDFRDLGSGGPVGMIGLRRRIGGRHKYDAGEGQILLRSESEGKMAVDAVAGVGRDGSGVAVKLGLSNAEGGVGGLASSGGGDRGDDGRGKVRGDGGSGGKGSGCHGEGKRSKRWL